MNTAVYNTRAVQVSATRSARCPREIDLCDASPRLSALLVYNYTAARINKTSVISLFLRNTGQAMTANSIRTVASDKPRYYNNIVKNTVYAGILEHLEVTFSVAVCITFF